MIPPRHLLRIDSIGGLAAGTLVLALAPWLSTLYAVPKALVVGMGGSPTSPTARCPACCSAALCDRHG